MSLFWDVCVMCTRRNPAWDQSVFTELVYHDWTNNFQKEKLQCNRDRKKSKQHEMLCLCICLIFIQPQYNWYARNSGLRTYLVPDWKLQLQIDWWRMFLLWNSKETFLTNCPGKLCWKISKWWKIVWTSKPYYERNSSKGQLI